WAAVAVVRGTGPWSGRQTLPWPAAGAAAGAPGSAAGLPSAHRSRSAAGGRSSRKRRGSVPARRVAAGFPLSAADAPVAWPRQTGRATAWHRATARRALGPVAGVGTWTETCLGVEEGHVSRTAKRPRARKLG